MASIKIYNMLGEDSGSTISLKKEVFGAEYNEALIHQVVVAQDANLRQGTKSTLTRSEVRGGGAKPWRQKGTGRARQGSIRSPQWIKGGVVFAPKSRDFSKKMNVKAKAVALLSALSQKIRQNELTVLDKFALAEAKTKIVAETVDNLGLKGSVIFVVSEYDEVALRASRNIPTVSLAESRQLSVYEIVSHKNIVITADAIKKIEEEAK